MSEPTTTQRSRLIEIELTHVVAYGQNVRNYCTRVHAYTMGNVIEPCREHLALDNDCVACWEAGKEHKPCGECRPA